MELRQLKAFVTAAKVGSFTQAAELLDYAQSSISAQISSLENEMGKKIFERLGRKVVLTKEGERLLAYAEEILRLSSEAKEALASTSSPNGSLVIGAYELL